MKSITQKNCVIFMNNLFSLFIFKAS